jgi:hypothetical protein
MHAASESNRYSLATKSAPQEQVLEAAPDGNRTLCLINGSRITCSIARTLVLGGFGFV